VLPLPPEQRTRALRYGIGGAFAFRILSTLFATYMIHWNWVKLIGALYLLYLPAKHFIEHPENRPGGAKAAIKTFLGLSAFWSTVIRVELTDIVFAIDSILVAVAMSRKAWVIVTGGILGILAMRLLIGQLLGIVQRYPAIVDGAYVIVAWVGIKLMIEYFHSIGLIAWEVPRWLSITVVFVLFGMSAIYARWKEQKKTSGVES
jgi:YkoY family integral membrane protein